MTKSKPYTKMNGNKVQTKLKNQIKQKKNANYV